MLLLSGRSERFSVDFEELPVWCMHSAEHDGRFARRSSAPLPSVKDRGSCSLIVYRSS